MKYLYRFVVFLVGKLLFIPAIFNRKLALFVKGRKETFSILSQRINPGDKTIWMHCASLGEFEQGRPLLETLYHTHPEYKIVLSFYSPSGYEIRKDFKYAHAVVYLPLDSPSNAERFLTMTNPSLAIFVKYEFWPNFLDALKRRSVKTILVSGIFREDQIFFKAHGGWMKNSLKAFSHFFVQNEKSKELLGSLGIGNVTVSGDTRFDRVAKITEQENELVFLNEFARDKLVIVAGSTWPEDESYLLNFINQNKDNRLRFIIAPHNINAKEIEKLKKNLDCTTTLYSENKSAKDSIVFIADTIGLLTKIYSYADIAYVGGGFGKEGVHNVLEPAVFGVPLVIGPIYDKFEEAVKLVELGACLVADNGEMLLEHLAKLTQDEPYRLSLGAIAKSYISTQQGASEIILDYIGDMLLDIS